MSPADRAEQIAALVRDVLITTDSALAEGDGTFYLLAGGEKAVIYAQICGGAETKPCRHVVASSPGDGLGVFCNACGVDVSKVRP